MWIITKILYLIIIKVNVLNVLKKKIVAIPSNYLFIVTVRIGD